MRPCDHKLYSSPDTDFSALSSVADTLAQRLGTKPLPTTASRFELGPRLGASWANTMPAGLDAQGPAELVCEPLLGLSIREMPEPEVFSHFFGSATRR
ncbi:hypothetical protein [Piscinibacter sp.]|jgi:hypothetical protein|uniref:hypothetical protein n=1 Tax=Piscinibacter sp. TaxID=1903157 RepID=UPI002F403B34